MASPAVECLSGYQISLRVGYAVIAPDGQLPERLSAAVAEYNRAAALPELDAELNPEMLDPDRVRAFIERVCSLDAATLSALRGRIVYLNSPTLQLGAGSPVSAEALAQGYTLTVPEGAPGALVEPVLSAPIDVARARDLAQRARRTMEEQDRQVQEMDKRVERLGDESDELPDALNELSLARTRRYAAALVWRRNSAALAASAPSDASYRADAEAARRAASEFLVPPWISMPGGPPG